MGMETVCTATKASTYGHGDAMHCIKDPIYGHGDNLHCQKGERYSGSHLFLVKKTTMLFQNFCWDSK